MTQIIVRKPGKRRFVALALVSLLLTIAPCAQATAATGWGDSTLFAMLPSLPGIGWGDSTAFATLPPPLAGVGYGDSPVFAMLPSLAGIGWGDSPGFATLPMPHAGVGEAQTDGVFSICPKGDVNRDLCVNIADLLIVRNNLGKTGSGIPSPCYYDLAPPGQDGMINVADLLVVRNNLGKGICQ
jgi:hypothetical protein